MTAEDNKKPWWSLRRLERLMLPGWILQPGNEELRRIAIIAYPSVLVAVSIFTVYGILRLFRHDIAHTLVNFLFAVVMLGILLYHRQTKRSDKSLTLYMGITAFGMICIFLFISSGFFGKATYLWAYIFPLIVFPITGTRRGTIAVILFLVLIFILLFLGPAIPFVEPYPRGFAFPFIPSILVVSILSYIYEAVRERNQRKLKQVNATLERSNEEMEKKIKERTAKLAQSEKNHRFLTERMSDIVWTADMNLDVTYVSPSVTRMLGFSQEEYRGIPFREKVTPDSFNRAMAEYAAGIERENTPGMDPDRSLQIELEFYRKDGSTAWLELLLNIVRDSDGNMVGVHGVSRDITDRKRKEKTLKRQRDKLRELSAKLVEAEEAERRRISRELHDQVGQNLATLGLNLTVLQSMMPAESPSAIQRHIEESVIMLEQTTEFIRDLMGDLRPPVMDDYGLNASMQWYGSRFSTRTGIEFSLRGEDAFPRLGAMAEVTLFRIFQEALINVFKHARAGKVDVSVEVNKNKLKLTIVDDGVGFDLNKLQEINEHHGWGLTTMAERAESINASFSIESQPGRGTKITVEAAI